jgi:hypothetical protein
MLGGLKARSWLNYRTNLTRRHVCCGRHQSIRPFPRHFQSHEGPKTNILRVFRRKRANYCEAVPRTLVLRITVPPSRPISVANPFTPSWAISATNAASPGAKSREVF